MSMLEEIIEDHPDCVFLKADGFDDAVVGCDPPTERLIYSFELAQQMQIPSGRRDLFIDLVDDQATIEAKLWELAELAATKGQAIGIGHDRDQTLLALEAVLPRLESRGFHFVHISAIVD